MEADVVNDSVDCKSSKHGLGGCVQANVANQPVAHASMTLSFICQCITQSVDGVHSEFMAIESVGKDIKLS